MVKEIQSKFFHAEQSVSEISDTQLIGFDFCYIESDELLVRLPKLTLGPKLYSPCYMQNGTLHWPLGLARSLDSSCQRLQPNSFPPGKRTSVGRIPANVHQLDRFFGLSVTKAVFPMYNFNLGTKYHYGGVITDNRAKVHILLEGS